MRMVFHCMFLVLFISIFHFVHYVYEGHKKCSTVRSVPNPGQHLHTSFAASPCEHATERTASLQVQQASNSRFPLDQVHPIVTFAPPHSFKHFPIARSGHCEAMRRHTRKQRRQRTSRSIPVHVIYGGAFLISEQTLTRSAWSSASRHHAVQIRARTVNRHNLSTSATYICNVCD